jgi:hypothetical protein
MARLLPTTRGLFITIDDCDYNFVSQFKWSAKPASSSVQGRFYAFRNINGKTTYLHRFLLDAKDGQVVDHANGDGLDNRRCNIRFASLSDNAANRISPIPNQTGFRGVRKKNQSFRAIIGRWPKRFVGPCRKTAEEAACDYDAEVFRRYGIFSVLNFPSEFEA